MARMRVAAIAAVVGVGLSGCAATAKSPIINDCVLGPTNSCVQVDLRGQNLSNLDLSAVNFTDADLRGANLTNANFAGANLFLADLSGATVTGATFTGTNLIGTVCPNGKTAAPHSQGGQPRCPDLEHTGT